LVGASSFRVVARRFIAMEQPGSPSPHAYGDGLPRFIRSLGNSASIEYVADIAELEMLRWKAYHAAIARPLPAAALRSLKLEMTGGLRLTLHPSLCLLRSRFPIVTIWENNQIENDDRIIERWVGETALIARPFLKVEIRRLSPGGHVFLQSLLEGHTVASAVRVASETTAEFEAIPNLRLIEKANVIVGFQKAS
jgi:hypothetical protein